MKNIFVGNLSYNVSENAVRSLFEEYGQVDRVSIVTDRETGQQKGFAFVEMSVDAEGDRAIASLSGRELNGLAFAYTLNFFQFLHGTSPIGIIE